MRFEAGAPKHAKHAIKIHRTLLQIEDHIKQNIDPGTYLLSIYVPDRSKINRLTWNTGYLSL